MDSYKEAKEVSYKKQLIVPLVILVISMITLSALGFAYSHATELEIEKNGLDSEYYEIDYTDNNGVTINSKLDAIKLSAYTQIAIDTSTTPPTRTFDAYFHDADITKDFYVTIRSDMSADTVFTLNTTVELGDVLGQFLTYDNTSAQTDVAYDKATIHAGDTVKVTITLHIGNTDIKTITGITPSGDAIDDVGDLDSALDSICSNTYNIKVTAIPTA